MTLFKFSYDHETSGFDTVPFLRAKNWAIATSPTTNTEKESFFEYNHVQKDNINGKFVPEFEFHLSKAGRSAGR